MSSVIEALNWLLDQDNPEDEYDYDYYEYDNESILSYSLDSAHHSGLKHEQQYMHNQPQYQVRPRNGSGSGVVVYENQGVNIGMIVGVGHGGGQIVQARATHTDTQPVTRGIIHPGTDERPYADPRVLQSQRDASSRYYTSQSDSEGGSYATNTGVPKTAFDMSRLRDSVIVTSERNSHVSMVSGVSVRSDKSDNADTAADKVSHEVLLYDGDTEEDAHTRSTYPDIHAHIYGGDEGGVAGGKTDDDVNVSDNLPDSAVNQLMVDPVVGVPAESENATSANTTTNIKRVRDVVINGSVSSCAPSPKPRIFAKPRTCIKQASACTIDVSSNTGESMDNRTNCTDNQDQNDPDAGERTLSSNTKSKTPGTPIPAKRAVIGAVPKKEPLTQPPNHPQTDNDSPQKTAQEPIKTEEITLQEPINSPEWAHKQVDQHKAKHAGHPQETDHEFKPFQAIAVHPYAAMRTDELSLCDGDLIEVVSCASEHWWEGRVLQHGGSGWFPSVFVKVIESAELSSLSERGSSADGLEHASSTSSHSYHSADSGIHTQMGERQRDGMEGTNKMRTRSIHTRSGVFVGGYGVDMRSQLKADDHSNIGIDTGAISTPKGTRADKSGTFAYVDDRAMLNFRLMVGLDLINSEYDFTTEIELFLTNVAQPLKDLHTLPDRPKRAILAPLFHVVQLHNMLYTQVYSECEGKDPFYGKVFLSLMPDIKKVYMEFASAHPVALEALRTYADHADLNTLLNGVATSIPQGLDTTSEGDKQMHNNTTEPCMEGRTGTNTGTECIPEENTDNVAQRRDNGASKRASHVSKKSTVSNNIKAQVNGIALSRLTLFSPFERLQKLVRLFEELLRYTPDAHAHRHANELVLQELSTLERNCDTTRKLGEMERKVLLSNVVGLETSAIEAMGKLEYAGTAVCQLLATSTDTANSSSGKVSETKGEKSGTATDGKVSWQECVVLVFKSELLVLARVYDGVPSGNYSANAPVIVDMGSGVDPANRGGSRGNRRISADTSSFSSSSAVEAEPVSKSDSHARPFVSGLSVFSYELVERFDLVNSQVRYVTDAEVWATPNTTTTCTDTQKEMQGGANVYEDKNTRNRQAVKCMSINQPIPDALCIESLEEAAHQKIMLSSNSSRENRESVQAVQLAIDLARARRGLEALSPQHVPSPVLERRASGTPSHRLSGGSSRSGSGSHSLSGDSASGVLESEYSNVLNSVLSESVGRANTESVGNTGTPPKLMKALSYDSSYGTNLNGTFDKRDAKSNGALSQNTNVHTNNSKPGLSATSRDTNNTHADGWKSNKGPANSVGGSVSKSASMGKKDKSKNTSMQGLGRSKSKNRFSLGSWGSKHSKNSLNAQDTEKERERGASLKPAEEVAESIEEHDGEDIPGISSQFTQDSRTSSSLSTHLSVSVPIPGATASENLAHVGAIDALARGKGNKVTQEQFGILCDTVVGLRAVMENMQKEMDGLRAHIVEEIKTRSVLEARLKRCGAFGDGGV
ncbi:hypothetical protein SARC_05513 [Sphaeroforma arctica JP610]|uniref:SH3 domain-containing protein n=1 Tax=Sphaeroforma arctica JP610 TaxID=667725 RepID=A0A0L0G1X3_9EUKA|nr:hypothetical protein SARC_05513 [Sphaeroforma arctica JP610]KNC82193.1 hypothetical protein SARC_05513 [Sphaeroforma arctica JP610]|eukprot:XP_014156095.1 hypothetical protein SARC_05513 [Sphaeroforma arctica JP610]